MYRATRRTNRQAALRWPKQGNPDGVAKSGALTPERQATSLDVDGVDIDGDHCIDLFELGEGGGEVVRRPSAVHLHGHLDRAAGRTDLGRSGAVPLP